MDISSYLDKNSIYSTDGKVSLESHCLSVCGGSPQISNEGFRDLLKRIRDWWNTPSKPSSQEMVRLTHYEVESLRKRLESTYMNDEWIKRRKINVNSIKLDPEFKFITVNGGLILNHEEALPAIKDLHDKFKENAISRYETFITNVDLAIQSALRSFVFDPQYLTAEVLKDFNERMDSVRSRVSIDYRVMFGNTRLARTVMLTAINDRPFDTDPLKIDQIDALTIDQVREVCKILISLSEQCYEFSSFYETIYKMRSREILKGMCIKVRTYIKEVEEHYRVNRTPVAEQGSLQLHYELIDLFEEVRGIGGSLMAYHMSHLTSIIGPYARLIDLTVK